MVFAGFLLPATLPLVATPPTLGFAAFTFGFALVFTAIDFVFGLATPDLPLAKLDLALAVLGLALTTAGLLAAYSLESDMASFCQGAFCASLMPFH